MKEKKEMPFIYVVSEAEDTQTCFCAHTKMPEKQKIMFCELPHFPKRRAPTCGLDFH